MNKKEAIQNGYNFYGAYSSDKEEMKQKAKSLREEGNKAIVVNTPPSPLSRGYHSMGYSVYWIESDENKNARKEREKKAKINFLMQEREKINQRLQEIDFEIKNLNN